MLNVTDFIIGLKIVKERYLLKADFEIHIFVLKLNCDILLLSGWSEE